MRWNTLIKSIWIVVLLGIGVLAAFTLVEYPGSTWVYLLFTALSTALLVLGFGRGALFFDAFIGVLLWIGFWLKFSVRTAFHEGRFNIAVGGFDGSATASDQALLVACCAFGAILLVRLLRQCCFAGYPPGLPEVGYRGLYSFYRQFRTALLTGFVVAVLVVAVSNAWLGIYQRGLVSRTVLPFGLNGVYAWLLMFGMASVSALILRFEFELNRERYWLAILIALLEAAVSNISLWSRGMVLNGSALMYGAVAQFKRCEGRLRLRLAVFVVVLFGVLFGASVIAVNTLRTNVYFTGASTGADAGSAYTEAERGGLIVDQTTTLFLDRWVGIEGVMAVVAAGDKGWPLFEEALAERLDKQVNAFYDRHFIVSAYDNTRGDGLHFVSLPGYIAFLFYPGSYVFLFCAVALFSVIAALFEYTVYRLGGRNLVFCALIAQVIAFRYTSFGYVPMQSYMLFGSILLNVLILFCMDRLLRSFYKI